MKAISAAFAVLLLICAAPRLPAVSTRCDVCGQAFGDWMFTSTDKVDQTKKWLCESCAGLTTTCYVCGVPAKTEYLTLTDGRIVCKRDQAGLVVDEEEALRVCLDVDQTLQALLGRFTQFPSTNLHLRLADRVDVRTLVGVAGHDVLCPNLMGYTMSLQKPGHLLHDIRLLTGMQKGILQATYAHELAHAWVNENLPRARSLGIHPDALEGFCELLGFLVAQAYRDQNAMTHVLNNEYTRGQVHLFIEAERQYGFADILDWVRYGNTFILVEDRLQEVRDVTMPDAPLPRPVSEILFIPTARAEAERVQSLELTSITISPKLAVATINGRTFERKEQRKVPWGGSNVVIRCLAIEPDAVVIERGDTGAQERLELRKARASTETAP